MYVLTLSKFTDGVLMTSKVVGISEDIEVLKKTALTSKHITTDEWLYGDDGSIYITELGENYNKYDMRIVQMVPITEPSQLYSF